MRIRDGKNSDPGWKKVGSATLNSTKKAVLQSRKSELRLRLQLLHEHFCGLWISFDPQIVLLATVNITYSDLSTFSRGLMQPCNGFSVKNFSKYLIK